MLIVTYGVTNVISISPWIWIFLIVVVFVSDEVFLFLQRRIVLTE